MGWLGGFEGGLAPGVPATGIEGFKAWLAKQPPMKGLQLIALHNAGAPNIAQTEGTPGGFDQRQRNIAVGYKGRPNYWRGGPAFNVYPDGTIRGGTPWGEYGVHSPSWNDIGIGIEMMADFSKGHDDDDAGKGLVMKNVACEMIAAILRHQGLPVSNDTVKLHKEDKATSHDCPGADIEKPDIMRRVQGYYDAMGTPGDHAPEVKPSLAAATPMVVAVDGLNLRSSGGMAGKVLQQLAKGQAVKVWSIAANASTKWAHITGTKDGKTYFDGYVALSYLALPPPRPLVNAPPASDPVPTPTPPPVVVANPSDYPHWGFQIITSRGYSPMIAAAMVGNWQVESYPDLRPWVTGDKINGVYTAFGIAQWRGDRYKALQSFAESRGKAWDDFETQVLFGLQELFSGAERTSGALLLKARTIEEATAAMVSSERPAGWKWPADRTDMAAVLAAAQKVSHWDWRLQHAKALA